MTNKDAIDIIKENEMKGVENELNDLREEKVFALYEIDTFKGGQPKKKIV